ncbi:helix-turn-helix transcriptional regulator [Streptomyces sp. W16]|uniref:helix-turn-helix domain-containing protein n=1 Tax=Streptomyces sp. W16 TaxID=3076631 RepID=UPI00295B8A15|nr:helix-turn-helix transcriptional regulator [Streptomyces sp. W16]MDV9168742.1 helix-turn-helix transcriptional regulator [Streptomyces sp. W16]
MAARAFNGPALRDQRRLAGLSVAQLATAVGRTPWTIWDYETGRTTPPVDVAAGLADALDLRLDQLLTRAELAVA